MAKGSWDSFKGYENILKLIVVTSVQLYEYTKSHWIKNFKKKIYENKSENSSANYVLGTISEILLVFLEGIMVQQICNEISCFCDMPKYMKINVVFEICFKST